MDALSQPPQSRCLIVEACDVAVTNEEDTVLMTGTPVGSSVAVCLWEPKAHVSGLLHFWMPDSKVDPEGAQRQPARFADTGLLLLLGEVRRLGASNGQCKVRLIGGAEVADREHPPTVWKRNVLAARRALWSAGLFIDGEEVGGTQARRATMTVKDGQLLVTVESVTH